MNFSFIITFSNRLNEQNLNQAIKQNIVTKLEQIV